MSTDKAKKHILIIGGGIAGKALALFLLKASTHPLSTNFYTTAIYETYPKPNEILFVGGGLGLAPNGIAVLSDLGLTDELKKHAGRVKKSSFYSEGGTKLASWSDDGDGEPTYGEDMWAMMRSTLYDILSNDLEKKALAIEYGKRVVNVEERGDKVVVEFEDGSTAEGDYLIGADGASLLLQINSGVRSAVRTQVFPGYPKPEFIGLNGAGGFVKKEDIPPNIPPSQLHSMNFVFGKNGFFGFSPASEGVILHYDQIDDRE
jgi:2-polyprenyl-6-methoxyphenol hydroxylase-like FAD-dependent oxidoreductase